MSAVAISTPQLAPRAFLGACALVFLGSAAATVAWCGGMAGMPMCGGRALFTAHGCAVFLGMWSVMMVAMMLPVLLPSLLRYRRAVATAGEGGMERLTVRVALGYFAVWSAGGLVALPLSMALTRLPPALGALVIVAAGVSQLGAWKTRQLACCRRAPRPLAADAATAWRHGLHLGLRCCRCCASLSAILLVLGVMDLKAMALVTAAISAERLAPDGERFARASGVAAITVGVLLLSRGALPW